MNITVVAPVVASIVATIMLIYTRFQYHRRGGENNALLNEIDSLRRRNEYLAHHIENVTRRTRESLVGAKVITKSNENEPYHIGTVMRFESVSKANNLLPIIAFNDGKEYLCMGAVVPLNKTILKKLVGLSNKEQWEFLAPISLRWE